MKTKICTKCNKEKLLFEFTKDKRTKSGLSSRCKECNLQHVKNWTKNNRVKYTQQQIIAREKLFIPKCSSKLAKDNLTLPRVSGHC